MSELALQLIRENIEKHRRGEDARFLDLDPEASGRHDRSAGGEKLKQDFQDIAGFYRIRSIFA